MICPELALYPCAFSAASRAASPSPFHRRGHWGREREEEFSKVREQDLFLAVRPVCSFLSHQLSTSSVPSCGKPPLTKPVLGRAPWSTRLNTLRKLLQYSRAKTPRGFQARLLTKHLLEFRHKGTFNRAGLPGQSSSSLKAPNNLACNYILWYIVSYCVVNFVSSAQLEVGG